MAISGHGFGLTSYRVREGRQAFQCHQRRLWAGGSKGVPQQDSDGVTMKSVSVLLCVTMSTDGFMATLR